ncbi:transcriptional regulator BetI [Dongia mobilis]|jgi:TetR/AcrR family transcriptional repressor of bet genes|uniref:transcriptional regulator BetI n=1 Tax=Dongia sp. TaxID=1977262 RepID=UPI0026E984FF
MAKNAPIRSNRKKELIEATIAVIAAHGYHGTTVSRVAKSARVSTGLMNFHFTSKDKLFEEVFKYLADEYFLVWNTRIQAAPADAWSRLQTMVEAYFDRDVFTSAKLAVWFSFWSDPELRDKFRDAATAVERRYVKELEHQIYNLVILQPRAKPDARKIAVRVAGALSAMIDGFWLQALLYPKTFKAKDAIRSCMAFIKLLDLYYVQREKLAEMDGAKGRAEA